MTDISVVEEKLKRCEVLLEQMEQHAKQVESMYNRIERMVEIIENNSLKRGKKQEMEIKQELMKIAKKAAKKAAKKSLAIAKAKENIGLEP
ncbi:MAG: hypothetical protein R3E90_03230 [Marinicella sp.]|nr:hypothetical protein [Xanthomonadales bacterium]